MKNKLIFVLLLFLTSNLYAQMPLSEGGPEATLLKFIYALKTNSISEALSYCSPSFLEQMGETEEARKEMLATAPVIEQVQNLSDFPIYKTQYFDNYEWAVVQVGEEGNVPMFAGKNSPGWVIEKIDGEWKVSLTPTSEERQKTWHREIVGPLFGDKKKST